MMSPDVIFKFSNSLALLGWFALIFFGRIRRTARLVGTLLVPGLLSIVYVAILATHWHGHQGGFGTLPDVQLLFGDRWLVLMGWVHYLAFDLFVGSWQVQEAKRMGRSHLWTIPMLIPTFLFGPLGYLLFLVFQGVSRSIFTSPEQSAA